MDISINIKVLKYVFLIALNKLICFRIYLIWTFSETSIQPYSIFPVEMFLLFTN